MSSQDELAQLAYVAEIRRLTETRVKVKFCCPRRVIHSGAFSGISCVADILAAHIISRRPPRCPVDQQPPQATFATFHDIRRQLCGASEGE